MNIVTHLFNYWLHCYWLTDYFNFLSSEILYSVFQALNFFVIFFLLFFCMKTDENFENFIISKAQCFLCQFFFKLIYMFSYFLIVLFHRFIIANNGLTNFFLKISKKSLNNCKHFILCLKYFLFNSLLFLDSLSLLILYLFTTVTEFLYSFLEKGVNISNGFINTK